MVKLDELIMKNKEGIMKRLLSILLVIAMLFSITACGKKTDNKKTESSKADDGKIKTISYEGDTVEEKVESVLSQLTLEQKVCQMLQGAVYKMELNEMRENCYGSVLSNLNNPTDAAGWKSIINIYQEKALLSNTKIPFLYGNDAVHGHNTVTNTTIFPHNIGIGAANDPELTYKMGAAVAEEMKLSGVLWNFAPCVAQAEDPRWGRTYESYSTDIDIITSLSVQFAKGQLDHGIMPCAKHFIGDGNVKMGTGEPGADGRIIDRGDAELTDAEIEELLKPYKALIDAGVKTIMPSHSSINGVKMHCNKKLLTDKLKGELGFDGYIISDWESIHNVPGESLYDKLVLCINAGIDMLMQPTNYAECRELIITAVKNGDIPESRIDDAVSRILKVKFEMGLFDDPLQENIKTEVTETGSPQYRDIARQLVEKSLVLVKNDGQVLPLKKGQKVFVTGPAAASVNVQCGGWTIRWEGLSNYRDSSNVVGTTIIDGLQEVADEYDLTIITDKEKANEADVVILCVGESSYAEWTGDTEDLSLTGRTGLNGNQEAIELAKSLNKPTVTLIVAGRNVIIDEYMKDWDSIVMCYLPGTEGNGIANVLVNKVNFSGKLPMPWYKSVKDIDDKKAPMFETGYGLKY